MRALLTILSCVILPVLSSGQELVFGADTTVLDIHVANLADTIPYFGTSVQIANQGDSTLTFNWQRVNSNCQEGWGFIVQDMTVTLPPDASWFNVIPQVLEPMSAFNLYVEVVHEGLPGCCNVDIVFLTEANEVIDTCHFVFRVNSDCTGTSATDLQGQLHGNIKVYPNPASGLLNVTYNQDWPYEVAGIRILDLSGRDRIATDQGPIDISGLSPGLYYLSVFQRGKGSGADLIPFVVK